MSELEQKVASKQLGRKSGRGFYEWKAGKPVKPDAQGPTPPDLQDRMILPMLNEAVAVFQDGVVDDLELLDAGVIFGTGFAPFHGGPINYARSRGVDHLLATMETLEARYGERFKPYEGWSAID